MLTLALPTQDGKPDPAVETRPAELRAWLEGLPALDVTQNLSRIQAAIKALNQTPVKPGIRLSLLDEYRYPAETIEHALQSRLQAFHLPLSEKNRSLVQQGQQLQAELACGYKIVAQEFSNQGTRSSSDESHVIAVHRAIYHLTKVLLKAYEHYRPLPEGIWIELHALYTYAAERKMTQTLTQDPLRKATSNTTIDQMYKHAVLLGLSGPYQQPFHLIIKVNEYLEYWSAVVNITDAAQSEKKKCQFLVAPLEDRPGRPCYGDVDIPSGAYVLSTRPLVREAHLQLTAMNTGVIPKTGLGKKFYDDRACTMLRRLVVSWGINPTRRFVRTPSNVACNMAIGIDSVSYYLNGKQAFKLSSEDPDNHINMPYVGSFVHHYSQSGEIKHTAHTWLIVDEGACGYGLSTDEQDHCEIKIGDLLSINVEDKEDGWGVGLIRWMQNDEQGNVVLGVQKLVPNARPGAIKPVKAEGQHEDQFKPAVLLPEMTALNQPQTLVTARGLYRPERNLFLDTGKELKMIRAQRLIEETVSCDWFEFTTLDI
ncbi:MAG: hypothetical protein GXP09_04220 [Gammaproteobacteria bacterium]|nr:hypothetical protein [Gammaproteobacteria bacterium]